MATCKNCGKSGLFLKVSQIGLCGNCEPVITMDIERRAQIINESTEIIVQSSNIDTILSRFDSVLKHLEYLGNYEEKGIPTLAKPPSESFKSFTPEDRDKLIVYGLGKELEKLKSVLPSLATSKGKFNRIQKFYFRMLKFKSELKNPVENHEVEKEIIRLADEVGGFESLRKSNRKNQIDFHEMHNKSLKNYFENSDVIKGVQILASSDSCSECKKLTGITYLLSEKIPELPHPNCTHEMGCRCTYIPIVK
ncbi:MAG: hypothetical protein ACYC3P_04060 [Bellilinea sp.]